MAVEPANASSGWRFVGADEQRLTDDFIARGYAICASEDRVALDAIRQLVAESAAAHLGLQRPNDAGAFLDGIGAQVPLAGLNALRLHVIDTLSATPWFRAAYYACAKSLLGVLAGNELAMQRSLGLSVQVPDDGSSLLPLHSDVWSEDSPYEVVLWIPLVDCYRTKAMFFLPPAADRRWRGRMHGFHDVEALYGAVEPELEWLDVPYGSVLLFTHTLMHGNRVNRESTTRWSMNVRFKGLFTPYSDKQLGDFFDPITLRAASRIGLEYELPPIGPA